MEKFSTKDIYDDLQSFNAKVKFSHLANYSTYNYYLCRQNIDNLGALEKMTTLVTMIKTFHHVGNILYNGMLKPSDILNENIVENVDMIDVENL